MYTLRVEPISRDLEPIPPAVRALVDTLAAACPFCVLMLDSAAQSKGVTSEIAIKDIAEVVAEAI